MRYRILGPLEVSDRTGTVPVPHGRARLLLAVLLVHADTPVPNDRLIDALWGDAPPPTASRSLHNLVSGLRKSLGDGRLVTHPRGGYQLTLDGDEIDAARFDALSDEGRDALAAGDPQRGAQLLRDALALWRGPAFGELPTSMPSKPRSRGSRSCGWSLSRTASTPTSRSAATPR